MWVISVSKTYKHRGKNIKHRPNTKKFWQVMYYDYDYNGNLKLYSKFVNPIQAMFCKLIKCSQKYYYCKECENVYFAVVLKNFNNAKCPYCGS
jgi:hypothetical protein